MITVNGHPLDSPDARQLIGFVPQDDLLIEELTVYQKPFVYGTTLFRAFDGRGDWATCGKGFEGVGLGRDKGARSRFPYS